MDLVQKIIGGVLIVAGLYLGFNAFQRVDGIVNDPRQAGAWLELRDQIHRPALEEPKKKSLFKIDAAPSLFSDDQIHVLGGYLALFIGALYLALMAWIAVAFLGGGVRILKTETRKK